MPVFPNGHLAQPISEKSGGRGSSQGWERIPGCHMRQPPRWASGETVFRTLRVESCGCSMCISCRNSSPKQFKDMRGPRKARRQWLSDLWTPCPNSGQGKHSRACGKGIGPFSWNICQAQRKELAGRSAAKFPSSVPLPCH